MIQIFSISFSRRLIIGITSFILLQFNSFISYSQAPGCPNINAGPDQNLTCATNCTNLNATVLQTGQTNSYAVSSITYAPPVSFSGGTSVLVNIDDTWSSVVNLPFNFCFYGNVYNKAIIGANGLISFDLADAGGYCTWSFTASIPSNILYDNSIMGAFHDLDPSQGGDINYYILGSAPCRIFVVNFSDIPHFDCNCGLFASCKKSNQQIVIYETTNVVEVYVNKKETCSSWNSGNAVIGIQNIGATAGITPPGRNTGSWTATNEAWRFTPNGTPNYVVNWYDPSSNLIGTGLTVNVCPTGSTTYTGEVTYTNCDGTQVIKTDQVAISVAGGFSTSFTQSNPSCTTCNGSISVTASGGTPPFTFNIGSGNQSNGNFSSLCSGNYAISVTDAGGCTGVVNSSLTNPATVTVTPTQTNILCNSGTNGSASVSVSGGTGSYSYNWVPNVSSTNTAVNLSSGNYSVTVTDANGCSSTQSFSLTQPAPIIITPSQTNVTCGASDGSASVAVSGGASGYTYSWSPNISTSNSATGLSAGTYTVTVKDVNNCAVPQIFNISGTSTLALVPNQTNVLCAGNNSGSAAVSVSGGATPYTYQWTGGVGSGNSASNLIAGTYTITVTDAVNCASLQTFVISEPTALSVVPSEVDLTCFIGGNGLASVAVSGGTGSYSYTWSPIVSTTNSAGNLSAGNYFVTATDVNGCTITQGFSLTQPTEMIAISTQTNVNCSGAANGSATINTSGGVTPYSYTWAPNVSTSNTASNLSPGNYSITVSDGSCTPSGSELVSNGDFSAGNTGFSSSYAFTAPPNGGEGEYWVAPGSQISSWNGGMNSFGDHTSGTGNLMMVNGSVNAGTTIWCQTISVTPGTTYLFSTWVSSLNVSNPALLQFSINGSTLGNTFNAPASAGSWSPFSTSWNSGTSVTAQICIVNQNTLPSGNDFGLDDISFRACATSCTTLTSITISQPAALSVVPTQTNVLCTGQSTGSASITTSGGTVPYTFTWSTGLSSTNSEVNLSAGTYGVTVTDANSCTTTQSFTISEPPASVDVILGSLDNITCYNANNGSITVNTSGGVGPYTYQWLMNVSNTNFADSLITGYHGVMVSDANGCTDTMTFLITQPPVLVSQSTQTNVSCFGGNDGVASVTISGGVSPYSYLWNTGLAGPTISTLNSGTYNVTVTDSNSCTITQSYTITQPAAALALSPTQSNVLCSGGTNGAAGVSVQGGTTAYTYTWIPAVSTTGNATNLSAGSYSLTVTDNLNCVAVQSFVITEPALLSLSVSSTNVNCNSACDGTSTVSPSGGVTPYAYAWAPAPASGQGTATSTLCAGNYSVNITDSNNCSAFSSFVITEPATFTLSTVSLNSNCGQNDGSAGVTVTGATPSYIYLWDDGQSTATAANIPGGNHCVTVTDVNACDTVLCIFVTDNPPPTATTSYTNAVCNGDCSGTVMVTGIGGNPSGSYTYLWSNAQTGASLTALCAGKYYVTVTDNANCTVTDSATVAEPSQVTISVGASMDTICIGSGALLTAVADNGNGSPYSYTWDNSMISDTQTVSPSALTCYSVTATDKNGCLSPSATQCVDLFAPVIVTPSVSPPKICNTDQVTLSASLLGGSGQNNFQWMDANGNILANSAIPPSQSPPGSGMDTVKYFVSGGNDCPSDNDSVYVTFYPNPQAEFTASTTYGCHLLDVVFTNNSNSLNGLDKCWWDFGDGSPYINECNAPVSHSFPVGKYNIMLTVTSSEGDLCIDKKFKGNYIEVEPNPTADFTASPQPANVQQMLISFNDLSTGNGSNLNSWDWSFYDKDNSVIGISSMLNPEFNFSSSPDPTDYLNYFIDDTGDYPVRLIIKTEWGCKDTIEKIIHVEGVHYIKTPNAFSPDGDGLNDYFFPEGVGIMPSENFNFYIFNRWGDMIFESHNLFEPWDGTDRRKMFVPQGVYVWRIDINTFKGETTRFFGHVTVLKRD